MLFIYDGKRHRQSGTTMQKTRPAGEVARRASVRKVFRGFPAMPLRSEDEVRDYLSGDTICCLMCGRHLKALGAHLNKIHGMDASDYRARFNIPWRYGLVSAPLRTLKQAVGYRPGNKEHLKRRTKGTGYRKPCAIGMENLARACPTRGNSGSYKYTDFSWHLEQLRTVYGKPAPPDGAASWATFKRRVAADPELRAARNAAKAVRPVHERTTRRRNKNKFAALALNHLTEPTK